MRASVQAGKSEAAQDQAFMISRCLELWVADLRRFMPDLPAWDSDLGGKPSLAESFLPPFAASIHAMRLMPEFSRQVMPAMRDIALRQRRQKPPRGEADQFVCALVGEEFTRHCEILAVALREHSIAAENGALRAVVGKFGAQTARLRKIWSAFATDAQLPAISGRKQEALIVKNAARARFTDSVVTWRDRWRAGAAMFGSSGRFGSRSVGKAANLFELWSFYELAQALRQGGHEALVQSSLLRGTVAGDLYLDCRWKCHDSPLDDGTLASAAAPWFFRHRASHAESVLFDVKYKKASVSTCLHLLGAMTACGVRRGLLLCRREINFRGVHFSEHAGRFAFSRLGENKAIILGAIRLIPEATEMPRNEEVLRLVIQKVLQ